MYAVGTAGDVLEVALKVLELYALHARSGGSCALCAGRREECAACALSVVMCYSKCVTELNT